MLHANPASSGNEKHWYKNFGIGCKACYKWSVRVLSEQLVNFKQ